MVESCWWRVKRQWSELVLDSRPDGKYARDRMSSLTIALVSAVCIFGGVLLGLLLQNLLPEHHLSNDSKDTVKLGAGMVATLSDYGPETKADRELLRHNVAAGIEIMWPETQTGVSGLTAFERMNGMEMLQIRLHELTPTNDLQRQLAPASSTDLHRTMAVTLAGD